jgi:DNA-3-methyladenine glycosylase II
MKKYDNMFYEETFNVSLLLPFRLDLTVWALRRRQKNHIDAWDGTTYTRIFVVSGRTIQSQVIQVNNVIQVKIKSHSLLNGAESIITVNLNKMLGLDISLEKFYELSRPNIHLQSLAESFVGVKPPRFPTLFEALLNAVSCQQVTLDLGILLLNRLAECYGQKFVDGNKIQYAFPNPEDLQSVPEEEIKKIGFSYQKARAIKDLVQAFLSKDTSFSNLRNMTNEEVVISLSKLRGIGRWSSEYVLLRGFGRLNVFPGDDVGAQKNLQQLLELGKRPNYEEIKQLTAKWQPYAGLVYFHLLLEKLQKKNLL